MKYEQKGINNKVYYVHRLIMGEHLGRKLFSNEHVHHINGDKKDNRICNLEVLGRAEHTRRHMIGHKLSNETKKKISIANKISQKGKKLSEETKKKMSLSAKGKNTWSRGRKLSLETRKKISKSRKGIKFSKEHLINIHKAFIIREAKKRELRRIKSLTYI